MPYLRPILCAPSPCDMCALQGAWAYVSSAATREMIEPCALRPLHTSQPFFYLSSLHGHRRLSCGTTATDQVLFGCVESHAGV